MKIKVGPINYEIVEVSDLRADDDTKLYGQISWTTCEIRIKPNQHAQQRRQTIWHEIVHVLLEQLGCNKDINNEAFTTALAHALMQVVQDNPFLAEEVERESSYWHTNNEAFTTDRDKPAIRPYLRTASKS